MAFNPLQLVKLKERFGIFRKEHPKVLSFVKTRNGKAVKEGTVMEVKVTTPEGESYVCNFKMTPEDVKTIRMFIHD